MKKKTKKAELLNKTSYQMKVWTKHPKSKGSWLLREVACGDLKLALQIRTFLKGNGAEVSIEEIVDARTRTRTSIRNK